MKVLAALRFLLAVGGTFLAAVQVQAADLRPDDPAALAQTRSLGRVIADSGRRPVHIIFVHGMRAEGAGSAQAFMKGLCRYGPVQCAGKGEVFTPAASARFDLGARPEATVMGRRIWTDAEGWAASRPFVDRYVFQRQDAPPVVVDEVNWWPLLFPVKCKIVVAPDARLSGPNKGQLDLCRRTDDRRHRWLSDAEYEAALRGAAVSGGGAWANARVKQAIMNWGLADAVLALGPMRVYFRRAINAAFDYAAAYDGRGIDDQTFVVVSESLGSFVVMDAAMDRAQDTPGARAVVGRTADLYFFANQFALLELGRAGGLPESFDRAPPGAPADPSPFQMLEAWAGASPPPASLDGPPPRLRQIIAFNDPSDALTFDVPKLLNSNGSPKAIVVNIYDRNQASWLGLFANPLTAHTGHSRNSAVLRQMFEP